MFNRFLDSDRWRTTWVIAQRELVIHLQSTAYWVIWVLISGLIGLLAFIFGFLFLHFQGSSFLTNLDDVQAQLAANFRSTQEMFVDDSSMIYYVIDNTEDVSDWIRLAIRDQAEIWNPHAIPDDFLQLFTATDQPTLLKYAALPILQFRELQEPFESMSAVDSWLEDGKIDGYFVIPENFLAAPSEAKFVTRETGFVTRDIKLQKLKTWYEDMTSIALRSSLLEALGLAEFRRKHHLGNVEITLEKVKLSMPTKLQDRQTPPTSFVQGQPSLDRPLAVAYSVLFVFVLLFASSILVTNTVEEKSTRVNEVLCSKIKAYQILDGKMLGNTLVIGVLIALIGLSVFLALMLLPVSEGQSQVELALTVLSPLRVLNWLLFGLCGLWFYGPLFTALGSLCDDLKEVGMTLYPVSFIVTFGALPALTIALLNPYSALTQALTLVPPFTPAVMIARGAELPSWPTYMLVVVGMLTSIVMVRWVSVRIFANGILAARTAIDFRSSVRLATRSND